MKKKPLGKMMEKLAWEMKQPQERRVRTRSHRKKLAEWAGRAQITGEETGELPPLRKIITREKGKKPRVHYRPNLKRIYDVSQKVVKEEVEVRRGKRVRARGPAA